MALENVGPKVAETISYRDDVSAGAGAIFPDGTRVPIVRGRARRYPGLPSEAPVTLPLYELAAPCLGAARSVLDVGCGAGIGAKFLVERGLTIVAVDGDADAVKFARLYAQGATVIDAMLPDMSAVEASVPFDAAVVVDVLGQVDAPALVLRAVRSALAPGATLVIAEPRAYPEQILTAPVRRAFSPRGLRALLVAAGFTVTSSADAGAFCVVEATRRQDLAAEHLAEGIRRATSGDLDGALLELAEAQRASEVELRVEATLWEADVLFALERANDGCAAFLRAAELDPDDPRPGVGLSQVSLAVGDRAQARELAQRAVERDPAELTAQAALASVLETESPGEALTVWRSAASLAPDDFGIAVRIADVAVKSGVPEHGVSALRRLRAYGAPLGAEFHLALAQALEAAGQHDDAALERRLANATQ